MVPNTAYSIEELPYDVLGDIISRVARRSRKDVRNVMQASPQLAKAAKDHRVYKNINLRPLAMNPLAALKKYQDLMEKTIANGNVEAHYIKGIQEYFQKNNIEEGLAHLKKAAEGTYENAVYLYGIVQLCRGDIAEGKLWLDKLGWKENMAKGDQCWKDIKKLLHRVNVRKLDCYNNTLGEVRPTVNCSLNDMENKCEQCYYLKQMIKFVFFF
ncbi:PREDICTED: F-box protein At2g35280-like [Camelina sativa]|uniref:F-box protein At2g35280-like n=1 Tax=Camelina sativa TaxID=90675 RepID=A0ABM0Y4Y8_CAMSA|nr:PREDICTED: F-box protein At2g35280-like [Camelina sativa]